MRRLAAVIAVMALAGCSRVDTFAFPTAPPTPPPSPTTTVPNLTGVRVAAVAGRAASPVSVRPGPATISGTVVGPSGPVGGADVHIERLVGDIVGSLDVTAAPDGTWSLPGVLGGRYRVRAWRPPDLDQVDPEIFFLNGNETRSLTLEVQQWNASDLTAVSAPATPVSGEPTIIAVELTAQAVDAKGIVRAQPVPNASVELTAGSGWAIAAPNPAVTGSAGTASWNTVCLQPGPQPLAAIVNGTSSYPVNLPPCGAPPPPPAPTTTQPTPTSTPGAPSTTVKPRSPPAT